MSSKLPFSRRNEYNEIFSVKKQKLGRFSDTIYPIKKQSNCRTKQSRKIVPFELPFYSASPGGGGGGGGMGQVHKTREESFVSAHKEGFRPSWRKTVIS